jgi:large subunit ribosomal protein L25
LRENDVPNTTVVVVVDSVEVESLPTNIPESIEVDVSLLTEAGQVVMFSQLSLPEGVVLAMEEERLSEPVVILQEFKEEIEEEAVAEVLPEPAATDASGGDQSGESATDTTKS